MQFVTKQTSVAFSLCSGPHTILPVTLKIKKQPKTSFNLTFVKVSPETKYVSQFILRVKNEEKL